MDRQNLIKMAVDAYKGIPAGNYTVAQTQEALRNALIELNGGSTKLNFKALRSHPEMYTIIEEIITSTVLEGLPEGSPLYDYIDYRNLALGDSQQFDIVSNEDFVVSEIAEGTQGLRRQRLIGSAPITVATTLKGVKIYEELNRVLAGRIDFNEMINRVSRSFVKKINEDSYKAVQGALTAIQAPYKATGSFDAGKLATLIDHVEAATGESAIILTSKQGARKITGIVGANAVSANEDLYNMGYYGHFGPNPIIVMKNGHVAGSTNFVLDDDLYVLASNDKFIKFVTEGETTIINGDMYGNADLSQEYLMTQRYGLAAVFAGKAGIYEL